MRLIMGVFLMLSLSAAVAENRFNPYTGQWENTTPDAVIKHNPYNGTWQYADPDAKPKHNPFNGKWEMGNGKWLHLKLYKDTTLIPVNGKLHCLITS